MFQELDNKYIYGKITQKNTMLNKYWYTKASCKVLVQLRMKKEK